MPTPVFFRHSELHPRRAHRFWSCFATGRTQPVRLSSGPEACFLGCVGVVWANGAKNSSFGFNYSEADCPASIKDTLFSGPGRSAGVDVAVRAARVRKVTEIGFQDKWL